MEGVTAKLSRVRALISVRRVWQDDKGATLICVFGVTPFVHDDDAFRAVHPIVPTDSNRM